MEEHIIIVDDILPFIEEYYYKYKISLSEKDILNILDLYYSILGIDLNKSIDYTEIYSSLAKAELYTIQELENESVLEDDVEVCLRIIEKFSILEQYNKEIEKVSSRLKLENNFYYGNIQISNNELLFKIRVEEGAEV